MAQSSSYTPVTIYRSETAGTLPAASKLNVGELALNITDRKLYTKDSEGNVVEITNGNDHVHDVVDDRLIIAGGNTGEVLTKIDGTDYNVEWASSAVQGQAHRYWKVITDATSGSDLRIDALAFWTDGVIFSGSQRFKPGSRIDASSATASEGIEDTSASGLPNPTKNYSNLLDESAPTILFNRDTSDLVVSVDVDFNDPVWVSSVQYLPENDGSGGTTDANFSVVKVYYSDDGSNYTLANTFDAEGSNWDQTVAGWSPHFALVDDPNDGSSEDAIFGNAVRTVPPREGGGGFEWNYVESTSNVSAVAGTYYLVSGFSLGVTLPSNPSNGDKVAVRNVGSTNEVTFFTGNSESIEGFDPNSDVITLPTNQGGNSPAEDVQPHVTLIYMTVNNTTSWWVVNGSIDISGGS